MKALPATAIAIGVKLNAFEYQKGGFTSAECVELVKILNGTSVDLLELAGTHRLTTAPDSEDSDDALRSCFPMLNRDRQRALRASGLQARSPAPEQQKRIRALCVKARLHKPLQCLNAQSKFAQGERTLLAETPWAQPFQVLPGRVFGPIDIPERLLYFAPFALGFDYCGTTSIPVTVAYPSTGTKLSSSLP